MDYLSLCLICKDENDYLPEWLDYHILMGVDRFYIYDNESQSSLREALADYIKRGWVCVMNIAGRGVQLFAYDHCIQAFGPQTVWMGFIDTDEFLVPKSASNLKDFLKGYETYAGVGVSSLFFGSSRQQHRPQCGQIAGYCWRTHQTYYENNLIKSIVQPSKILFPNSPHDFIYKENAFCVNEKQLRIDYQRFPNYIDKIQLNHYFCRSLDEIEQKLQRGRGAAASSWKRARFDNVNTHAIYQDVTILQNLAALFRSAGDETIEINDLFEATCLTGKLADLAHSIRPLPFDPPPVSEVIFRPEMVVYKNKKDQLGKAEEEGNYEDVKRLLVDKIEEIPYLLASYVDLSTCLLKLNDPASAWQMLSQAWQMGRNSYRVLVGMTYYFLRVGNFQMAEKTCKMLLDMAPNELVVLGMMTESFLGQGRYEEAIKIGVPVVEVASVAGELPDGMSVYLIKKMAYYLVEKKDYQTAIHLWEVGMTCTQGDIEPVIELVKVLLHQGNRQRAQLLLAEAQKIAPQNDDIKILLQQLNKLSQPENVKKHLKKTLRGRF
jgi:Tfp pilus assembly protein PilF